MVVAPPLERWGSISATKRCPAMIPTSPEIVSMHPHLAGLPPAPPIAVSAHGATFCFGVSSAQSLDAGSSS